jgi:Holliday junction resolvase
MTNSRRKGADGERELVRVLRGHGFDARRGQQYCGAHGDADVVGLPGLHLEVKRKEALRLYDAMAQARHEAREGETPVVVHRRNNCP